MSSNLSKISFYSLIAVLVSITTVALPEVQAVEPQPTPTVEIVESPKLVFASDYSEVLGALDETNLETLENIQEQESQKIEDELERIRLEEERKRREAEEAARLAAIRAAQQRQATQPVAPAAPVPGRISGDFEGAIRSRCAAYGCNSTQVIRVMYCESGGRSNAVNGIHKGLFQFNPNTFRANANRVGITNQNIWDPYQQITVATWMFANGQAWQWSCK
jgi:predicted transcriptional regulator